MAIWFKSDNTAGVAPQVMAALARANEGFAAGYGDDDWTQRLDAAFSAVFERKVRVYPVATGTAANSLALACLVPPWGSILAHEEAHIVRDEATAPEFMTGGARIVALPGIAAKLDPDTLRAALAGNPESVHTTVASAVSISQCTELGAVYRPAEIAAVTAVAHAHGLRAHMDGARIANAVQSLGCTPADVTWRSGVDVLSFGATKNGALAAEAVVFFDPALAHEFERRRKRAGHLLSKMRFVSAQLLAMLDNGLWLQLAAHANRLAGQLAAAADPWLMHRVEANELFLQLGPRRIAALRAHPAGFRFYDWGAADSGQARFVVSWNQPETDVAALAAALEALDR